MSELALFQSQRSKATCFSRSVSKLPLSTGLNSRDVERLETLIIERIKVKKGSALYRMGDPLRSLYAIRVGAFKTRMMAFDGRHQIIGFQVPGDMLGLEAISSGHYGCDALALEDSEVCSIHFLRLEKLSQDLPALQHNLHKLMSHEIVRDLHMLFLIGNLNSDERLADFLLNLSQQLSPLGNSSTDFVLKMKP
jgi:CRP/FNR family transcriptional regulator